MRLISASWQSIAGVLLVGATTPLVLEGGVQEEEGNCPGLGDVTALLQNRRQVGAEEGVEPLKHTAQSGVVNLPCNLTERRFVIILSAAGRTGSTSILGMVNQLPGVQLGGEHAGYLSVFRDLFAKVEEASKKDQFQLSSWSSFQAKPEEVYCLVQDWVFLHTGADFADGTIHGFKEIKYRSAPMLDFLRAAFPKAQFIISYREDVFKQAHSGWHTGTDRDYESVRNATQTLLEFAANHKNSTFLLPLEQFGHATFTRLFAFLGFPQCRAVRVVHHNARSSYTSTADAAEELRSAVSCA